MSTMCNRLLGPLGREGVSLCPTCFQFSAFSMDVGCAVFPQTTRQMGNDAESPRRLVDSITLLDRCGYLFSGDWHTHPIPPQGLAFDEKKGGDRIRGEDRRREGRGKEERSLIALVKNNKHKPREVIPTRVDTLPLSTTGTMTPADFLPMGQLVFSQ